jgi:hypothetical protein
VGRKPPHAAVRRDGRQQWPEPIACMSGCSPGALRHGPGGRHPWRAQRRCTPSYPQSNRCYCAPTVPGLLLAKPQRPREGWPVACGLSPESYGKERIEGPAGAGLALAAASCSPCLPSTCIIVQPCLPACLPACLLACLLLLLSCCSPLCPSLHRSRASAHLISRPACAPLCLHSQSAFTALKFATSGQRRAASLVTDCLVPVPSNHSLVTPPWLTPLAHQIPRYQIPNSSP